MINILIVDDSQVETMLLRKLFESEPDIKVIAVAQNGKEAVELTKKIKPDLITMDIEMPIMDGYEATRLIMTSHPTPIVVVSSRVNNDKMHTLFKSLEAGALCALPKPVNILKGEFHAEKKRFIDTIRTMAEIKVIKRRFYTKKTPPVFTPDQSLKKTNYQIIAIGSSVGGPQVLKKILGKLDENFPIPIVVVQHMASGFTKGFTEWLCKNIVLNVKEAEQNEVLQKGVVYFAPDFHHLVVEKEKGKLIAKLTQGNLVAGFCPSITVLFQSIAKSCGREAIGMLLTGMGNDGAEGMLSLKNANAHTIIQDAKSAVVFGMAGVAQSLGAVDKEIILDQIADYLKNIVIKPNNP